MGLIEDLAHLRDLEFRPFADGRTSTNLCVLLFNLWCSSLGNEGTEIALQTSKGDQITIGLVRLLVFWRVEHIIEA